MTEKLIAEMKSIADFSATDIEFFINSLEASFIPKGEYFLKEGQISRHLGYVTSGIDDVLQTQ
jgi:CRP/FNR family transcriptional regulator, anaerobic regulatory protein